MALTYQLFKQSISARKAAKDVALSYKTALTAYDIMRQVFVEELDRTDVFVKANLKRMNPISVVGEKKNEGEVQVTKRSCLVSWKEG